MTKKPLILVVDDNIINRQYFSMSLKKSGYDVITAESGYLAIEQSKTTKFDVILMDIRMPEMDGYECTQRIRKISLQDSTPIYATSAEELFKDQADLFTGFLLKPISPKQLQNVINSHKKTTTSSQKVFDREQALKFSYNDLDIVNKMSSLFSKELPIQLITLKQLFTENKLNQASELIHKIRGSCKACGAMQLDSLFEALSEHIKLGNCNNCKNLVNKIEEVAKAYYISVA